VQHPLFTIQSCHFNQISEKNLSPHSQQSINEYSLNSKLSGTNCTEFGTDIGYKFVQDFRQIATNPNDGGTKKYVVDNRVKIVHVLTPCQIRGRDRSNI